jgi:hypothetical protein
MGPDPNQTPIGKIAHVLGHAKKSGGGYVCSCPCHDDKHASLSLTERDGKLLFKCHAGCGQAELVDEFKRRGWLNGAGPSRKHEPARVAQAAIVDTFPYVDRSICCADGTSRRHAIVAARKNGCPSFRNIFKCANIVILPDNDLSGRRHVEKVAASLAAGASVRVLNPGLGPKGDIINCAAAGGTAERLLELVESDARSWAPAPTASGPTEYFETAEMRDGKVQLAAIRPDAEVGPIMKLFDETLSTPEPPMRDANGWPVEVECRETAGLHELTPEGANDEVDEKSRLLPPKNLLLTKHDSESLEILLGDYVEFISNTKAGARAVAPPSKFIRHYLRYRRSKLSRCHAVLIMPLVLPSGAILASNGLDRRRRAVYRIDHELLQFIPEAKDCTPRAVEEAFQFLCDDWLCDVATAL